MNRLTGVLFAERSPCLPKISGKVLGMEQDIAALGVRVRARRDELGLSQEDIASTWGPSTTTLSKIEAGEAKAIRRRTAHDLEKSLGWKAGSVDTFLSGGAEPVAIGRPSVLVATSTVEDEPEADEWLTVTTERDADGRRVIVGAGVSTDPEGVKTRVELRYWPGDDNRSVSMSLFPSAVGEAHRLAIESTNIHRAPRDQQEEGGDNGTQTSAQKSELDRAREMNRRGRDRLSVLGESLDPAADDLIPEDDEKPGGSDDRD